MRHCPSHITPSTVASWVRSIALLLTGVLLMQGVPFYALTGADAEHCPCQANGYCAWSPGDAKPACAHHDHDAQHHQDAQHHHEERGQGESEHAATSAFHHPSPTSHPGPSLRSCGDMQPDAPAVMVLLKAFLHAPSALSAPARTPEPASVMTALTPQRTGADVFHPPKQHIG